ncbi:unnamed protein product [Symbiodinium sp. CCMP2592]|nr:unnamed protein product [Symbiodinium sp. CCMP2592]
MFWIYGCMEKFKVAENGLHTMHTFFTILAWSFLWLSRGQWPDADWNGKKYPKGSPEQKKALKPLAGGFYCLLFCLIGDLDYFAGVLNLPHFSSATNPCPLCRATGSGENTWANFNSDAPWRSTVWTPSAWRAWGGRSKSPLFRLPGTSCHTVSLDYLQTKYLGTDQWLFGSILWLLTHVILSASPLNNLKDIWSRIERYYKQSKTPASRRYRSLGKLSMFVRKTGYPKLRGKGYELKNFGRALLHVWEQCMKPHIQTHQQILLMFQMNVKMEDLLSEHKTLWVLPEAAAREFRESARAMLLVYNAVARHFAEEGLQLFDITSKFHLLQHITDYADCVSPRLVWCFSGEDLMRHMQHLAQSCSRGVKPVTVVNKMARKYRLAMHLQLTKP